MSDKNSEFERLVRLEEKIEAIQFRNDSQDERIDRLNMELVEGLKNQEKILKEMVNELRSQQKEMKNQQQEMHIAYEKMSSFSKGVLWLGGITTALATFFIRYGDKVKDFFGG